MSNHIRVPNSVCQEIIDFIRSKTPPGTELVINLVVPQGQEDVFVIQTMRTLETTETIGLMLDAVKAFIEHKATTTNEEKQ